MTETELRLKAIIDTAVDGIITINHRGTVESMNPSAARLFGYQPEDVIGKNINMLMPEPYHSNHDRYIQQYEESRKPQIIGIGREVVGKKKNGEIFPFYLSVSEIQFDGKQIYTGIVHDLSKEKTAQKKLKDYSESLEKRVEARTQALAQAIKGLENEIREREEIEKQLRSVQQEMEQALDKEKELNRLKTSFVSIASHEFRTPLATILSSINLIDKYRLMEADSIKQEKHINRIRTNVHNLTNILNDFLSVSKLEEGQIQAENEWFSFPELSQQVCEDLKLQAKAGQRIDLQIDESIGQIYQDERLFTNILVNLLSNAIKYSPENSCIIFKSSIQDERLTVTIQDEGMGIPEADHKHLFGRFFRAHNASHIQGTGLGLSIVKRHVELMGGLIDFTSKEGEGTTFHLSFPIKEAT